MLNLKVEKLTKCATTYNLLKWQWNTYVEAPCSQRSVSLAITQIVANFHAQGNASRFYLCCQGLYPRFHGISYSSRGWRGSLIGVKWELN